MKTDALLRLLHNRKSLVARIETTTPGTLAWLGVYPLDPTWPDSARVLKRFGISDWNRIDPAYRIRCFEVEKGLLDANVSIGEEEMLNKRDYVMIGDEALWLKFAELGVQLDDLVQPANSDYPI